MKKVSVLLAIFTMALCSKTFAQDEKGGFKPFKVDISFGYAIPSGGGGSKGGALFAIEPKYAIMDNVSLGLRIEGAVMISGTNLTTGTTSANADAKAAASYLATGDYYFTSNDIRPFAGVGAGIFSTAGVNLTSNNSNIAQGSKFGGMIRGGMEYKHLRIGLEYNLVGKTTVAPFTDNSTSPATIYPGYEVKNSYVGIKLGVLIGGGRR